MKAREFVNKKLGEKNYTHTKYPMSRTELEEWLIEYRVNSIKKYTLIDNILRYSFRILGLPFFTATITIAYIWHIIKSMINFIRFGGEAVIYTIKLNPKTMQDVYDKLTNEPNN